MTMRDKPIFVFLPACDEEKHIEELVNQLKQLELNLKIHVIDDGSKDATSDIARNAGAIVVRHPVNLGQWAALRTAFALSLMEDASVMVSVDADGQHDPRDLPKLVEPILEGKADIVVGSRFLENENPEMPKYRHAGIKLFNRLVELTTKKRLTDCTSGYKAYNMATVRKTLPNLRENQYGALEFILEAARQKARIIEKPIRAKNNAVSKKGKIEYGYNLLRTIFERIIHQGV
jgi:glycosyltransferase involved in cell wall biosynthesis